MVGHLLSANFSLNALNEAVVEEAAPTQHGDEKKQKFGTRATVSAGGIWGFFGWRVHSASTLGQQQKLFAQLKSELREKYLGIQQFSMREENDAALLNHYIRCAEKTGVYRGSDRQRVSASVIRLAAIKRLETDIDHAAAKSDAFVSPRMIADVKRRADMQFASIMLSGLEGYHSCSTGGQALPDQDFNPLKDYKSLVRGATATSGIIRLIAGNDTAAAKDRGAIASGTRVPTLTLASAQSIPIEDDVAQKTLMHCVASLKRAYFRVNPDKPKISTKEVAFDRVLSNYVESRLVDKTTGRLRELTTRDFHALERLAFNGRSTAGRFERPFDEVFGDGACMTAQSRYSGFRLGREAGVIHLIDQGGPHSMMFIETFDPEKREWHLTKLHFSFTPSSTQENRNVWQQLVDEQLAPGKIVLSEASVTCNQSGTKDAYRARNENEISDADMKIGRAVMDRAFGVIPYGEKGYITSMRLPAADIRKMLQVVKTQHGADTEGLQGNTALYRFRGKDVSSDELSIQLGRYQYKQAQTMFEFVRMQMILDKLEAFEREENDVKNAFKQGVINRGQTVLEAEQQADRTEFTIAFDGERVSLLQYLRKQGVLDLSYGTYPEGRSLQAQTYRAIQNVEDKVRALKTTIEARPNGCQAWERLKWDLRTSGDYFNGRVQSLLDNPSLCAEERRQLENVSPTNIERVTSDLWRNHRAIHQISQKIDNLSRIEALEIALKAARKELDMREASKAIAEDNWIRARNRFAGAAHTLNPGNGVTAIAADASSPLSTTEWRAHITFQVYAEKAAEQEKLVASLESWYNDLSADMIKGEDGYTATDATGQRRVRVGNCADWLRNILRLAGVTIKGIETLSGSSVVAQHLSIQDPHVLARGQYDSVRVVVARTGFKLHAPTPTSTPTVKEVAPEPRTASSNAASFLTQSRMHGVQYDAVWP